VKFHDGSRMAEKDVHRLDRRTPPRPRIKSIGAAFFGAMFSQTRMTRGCTSRSKNAFFGTSFAKATNGIVVFAGYLLQEVVPPSVSALCQV
jgi:hypothetical protein